VYKNILTVLELGEVTVIYRYIFLEIVTAELLVDYGDNMEPDS